MPKNSDSSPEKPKILDLLDDAKKLSRRERKQQVAEPPPEVPELPSALDVAKREALDLYADEQKPKVRKPARPGKSVLPTISKLLESEEKALQSQFITVLVVILGVMAVLIALVGGIGLMGTMSMNVMERTREWVMRSIGAVNTDLFGIVLVEGGMIGLVSWGLGILLSYPFSLLLCYITGAAFLQVPMELVYAPLGILFWLVIVVVLSVLASLIPAAHAVRLTVRDVLAYE